MTADQLSALLLLRDMQEAPDFAEYERGFEAGYTSQPRKEAGSVYVVAFSDGVSAATKRIIVAPNRRSLEATGGASHERHLRVVTTARSRFGGRAWWRNG